MKCSKPDKILRDLYIHSINECLFVLNAIKHSTDPVPDWLIETIHYVEWVYDNMLDITRDNYDSPVGINNH